MGAGLTIIGNGAAFMIKREQGVGTEKCQDSLVRKGKNLVIANAAWQSPEKNAMVGGYFDRGWFRKGNLDSGFPGSGVQIKIDRHFP